jgi:1-acyl-sn-glycerol-3-phosphate acyltransferase
MRVLSKRIRLVRRVNFRYLRLFLYGIFRFWLKKIHSISNLPQRGPCIIVSNHTSYVDWMILSAIYKKKYVVFLANKDLDKRPFINWLMKLNILIYIDTNNPGYTYFREVVKRLEQGHIVVIYPEGTRSKNGKMKAPKIGFVKLALLTGAPIVPLGIKGAFEILPPQKKMPRLQKCEIFVGDRIYLNKNNALCKEFFVKEGKRLSKDSLQEIAYRIMEIIRVMSGQEWDKSVKWINKPS